MRGTGQGNGTPIEGRNRGREGAVPMVLPVPSRIFAIFEGASEIQRMIIGRSMTGLNVR